MTASDPHELSISSEHQIDFARWQRPGERLMNELNENAPLPSPEPTMIAQKEIDLVQDITADCSVVASLCAVLAQSQGACREVSNTSREVRQTIN